jgi:hypothetical protein
MLNGDDRLHPTGLSIEPVSTCEPRVVGIAFLGISNLYHFNLTNHVISYILGVMTFYLVLAFNS